MPEYSGIAGVVPRGQPIEGQGTDQLVGFMEKLVQIKQAQKTQAAQQLESTVRMATQFGFQVDPKQIEKLVKKSGLPISMKTEDMAAGVAAAKANAAPGMGVAGAAMSGAQAASQAGAGLPGTDKALNPALGQKTPMSSQEKTGMWINSLAAQARRMINMKAASEEQKARYSADVDSLKSKVLQGGAEGDQAAGKLIQLGELKFDLSAANWYKMTPEQQAKAANVAAGAETEAQTNRRADDIAASFLPYFDNKADAYAAANVMVHPGASMPQELQAKMKKYSFNDLAEQTRIATGLQEMGLPSGWIGNVARGAQTAGLLNMLPAGMKSIGQQQLEIEQQRLGVEEQRYKKETEIAARAYAAEMRKDLSAQAKADLDEFKSLVELKKVGGNVPSDLLKAAQIKAGHALNMNVEEVKTLWDYITFSGPSGLKFTPRLSPGSQEMIDRAAGTQRQPKSEPSIMERLTHAVTGEKKEPI